MQDGLVGKYRALVIEVVGLYKQQLELVEQSDNVVFKDALRKIVVGLEGLAATDVSRSVAVSNLPRARALPATRHLTSLQNLPISKNVSPIVNLLIEMQDDLLWRQNPNYNDDLLGKGYMDNYCHNQIVGQQGFYQHPDILLGIYVQGNDLYYPDHNHPAKEVYTVLSGRSNWRQSFEIDGGEWQERQSGDFIFHDSLEHHAMHTNLGEPLIALYAWYGDINTDAALS